MKNKLRNRLISIAKEKITYTDPSHDIEHALRVLSVAEHIAKEEHADSEIIIPAALFHDIVNHPKNDPKAHTAPNESAKVTREILEKIPEYPKEKISHVCSAIQSCSFTKAIVPKDIETKILQDADGLEATGAISIMRTFSSTGQMKRSFYNSSDPFCENREPAPKLYAVDLFYARLLRVNERMHTETAKRIAKKRTEFLKEFLKQLKEELNGN